MVGYGAFLLLSLLIALAPYDCSAPRASIDRTCRTSSKRRRRPRLRSVPSLQFYYGLACKKPFAQGTNTSTIKREKISTPNPTCPTDSFQDDMEQTRVLSPLPPEGEGAGNTAIGRDRPWEHGFASSSWVRVVDRLRPVRFPSGHLSALQSHGGSQRRHMCRSHASCAPRRPFQLGSWIWKRGTDRCQTSTRFALRSLATLAISSTRFPMNSSKAFARHSQG